MDIKNIAKTLTISSFSYFPLLFILMLNVNSITAFNGTFAILSLVFMGMLFYSVIFHVWQMEKKQATWISLINFVLCVIVRVLLQKSNIDLLNQMLDISISSWLFVFMIKKFIVMKKQKDIFNIVIGVIFPYVCFLLFLPEIMFYMETPGLPKEYLVDFLSIENLMVYLVGVFTTIGLISILKIKNKNVKYGIVIFQIIMILLLSDRIVMNYDSIFYNAYQKAFIVYKIILLGGMLSLPASLLFNYVKRRNTKQVSCYQNESQ